MAAEQRMKTAAKVLDAWATALRGNWADIDGRQCGDQLNEISAYLRGDKDSLTLLDVGVCDIGSPHWDEGLWSWMHDGSCRSKVGGDS